VPGDCFHGHDWRCHKPSRLTGTRSVNKYIEDLYGIPDIPSLPIGRLTCDPPLEDWLTFESCQPEISEDCCLSANRNARYSKKGIYLSLSKAFIVDFQLNRRLSGTREVPSWRKAQIGAHLPPSPWTQDQTALCNHLSRNSAFPAYKIGPPLSFKPFYSFVLHSTRTSSSVISDYQSAAF
jgi:hypothetical protein